MVLPSLLLLLRVLRIASKFDHLPSAALLRLAIIRMA